MATIEQLVDISGLYIKLLNRVVDGSLDAAMVYQSLESLIDGKYPVDAIDVHPT